MYIDTHTHFDMCLENKDNKDITEESLIHGLKEQNVEYAVQISIESGGIVWSYEFSKKYDNILFTAGIHPSSKAEDTDLAYLSDFVEMIQTSEDKEDKNKLFGIGETGLDYYRMHQPRDMQVKSFEHQIDIAIKHNLPLIVHSRDAMNDTLDIISAKRPEIGIMHCFSGDSKAAAKYLDLGFYISFAGNLTYKNAHALHDAALYVPMDRLLFETDAPFLTPVPFRGKKNKPEYVAHTYKFFSELRGESLSNIEDQVYLNFMSLIKK